MISFQTISSFRARLQALIDIRKGVYSSVPAEIKREFESADIETIRHNRDMILIQNDLVIVKYRLGDKRMKLSKANGYRLIYMVSTLHERVVFLDIYPKRGPLQQLDIDDRQLMRLIEEYLEEDAGHQLMNYQF
ncbi:MAG: hypothetical protein UDK36_09450 [Bacteroidaceae bacterium]|nr:hypothetical protein [Bacteroidaceae bacterium]